MSQPTYQETFKGCLLMIVLLIVGYFGCKSCGKSLDKAVAESKEKDEILQATDPAAWRAKQIEKQFSAWDNSHKKLTEVIKSAMNDPGSYEHVSTSYKDEGDHLIVYQTYSGKNAFGGRVKGVVVAKVDLEGNVIEILSE